MELTLGLGIGLLVYLAFVFDVFGFLARDELWLRLLMLAASALYLVYYYNVTDQPLWDALITNGVLAAVNLAMIAVVVLERTTFAMSRETAALYAQFSLLSPGQFRRMLAAATARTAEAPVGIAEAGTPLDRLYFVMSGTLSIEKNGSVTDIRPGVFIGEIAYLTGDPASATVRLGAGARYLEWRHADLARLTRRSPALRNALLARINSDLAAKVAGSQPLPQA